MKKTEEGQKMKELSHERENNREENEEAGTGCGYLHWTLAGTPDSKAVPLPGRTTTTLRLPHHHTGCGDCVGDLPWFLRRWNCGHTVLRLRVFAFAAFLDCHARCLHFGSTLPAIYRLVALLDDC